MICPRCSIADIPEGSHQCPLCGFAPSANVLLAQPTMVDEILRSVQESLAERFQIDAVLRLGERSFVYRARETVGAREVALKVIPVAHLVDHELAKRFERQAALAMGLKHSHIVPVYAYGVTRAFLWYSMDLQRGRSLAEVMRETGPMDLDSCLRVAEQVASALDHAHRRDVMHGNLKPSNIFVDADRWVRVSDFAVVDAFGRPRAPVPGAPVLHMPEYLAPEQFYARSVGASADQYAFAVVLFQCLTGTLPFVGDSFEEVARLHANEPPPRLTSLRPDLPLPVAEGIQRALSKVPAGRFATVLDFTAALASPPSPPGAVRRSAPAHGAAHQPAPLPPPPLLVVDGPTHRLSLGKAVLILLATGVLGVSAVSALRPAWVNRVVERVQAALVQVRRGGDTTAEPKWETLEPPPASAPTARQDAVPRVTPGTTGEPTRSTPRAGTRESPSPAEAPGKLFVNSTPWGQLLVDGALIGNTPKVNMSLTPGTHVIRVVRDGFVPFERQIRITSGEVIRLTDIVLRPLEP